LTKENTGIIFRNWVEFNHSNCYCAPYGGSIIFANRGLINSIENAEYYYSDFYKYFKNNSNDPLNRICAKSLKYNEIFYNKGCDYIIEEASQSDRILRCKNKYRLEAIYYQSVRKLPVVLYIQGESVDEYVKYSYYGIRNTKNLGSPIYIRKIINNQIPL
jgi:hypothetical protein